MSISAERDQFTVTVTSLRAAAKAYYDTDTLLMSDAEYDHGIDQLRVAVVKHPAWV